MPKSAKFEITRLDAAGNPIVGAVITPLPQGAQVSSGGPTSFTVDDPGSIIAGSSVIGVSADGLTERSGAVSVASTTATNVTTSSGISGMVNNDRLVNTLGFTIYKDEQLNESVGATVTTDSNGYASGYFHAQQFDFKSVGGTSPLGTAVTRYYFDVHTNPAGWYEFFDFPTGSMIARRYDHLALATGDRFVEYRSGGVSKWYVGINASTLAVVPSHNVAGALTVDSGGFTLTAGALSLPASSIVTSFLNSLAVTTAKLDTNAVHPSSSKTLGGGTDVTITTSEVVRITTSYTPVSGNVGVMVIVNCPYIINGGVNTGGRVELRLYIGGTLKATGILGGVTGANEIFNNQGSITFDWIEPGMAASPTTFEVREIRVDTAGTTVGTYKGTLYQGYMTILEFKK